MGRVAKIESLMTPAVGEQEGAARNSLCLEGFERCAWPTFRRDGRGNRGFDVHDDDCAQGLVRWENFQLALIEPVDPAGHGKAKR